ncbi:hypothetical protein G8O24_17625 [Bradyrhizobium sp. INPA01-394B]|uniref:Uncharacterized protein n=1 Tax=Bradyrhizobium campsiandrae TaxID=1729892 RepID=A0ABR7UI29_9BRAD|nr:hypothetical protein [Bradyrhizobium campsiandrae]MBC9879163.1 hypothetical protein [Bradyrhizobium campsiandrae]MBC9983542.1 hypothetical protein [Bradyrhizobium campsiandrae]
MTRKKSGLDWLGFLFILFGTIGAATVAHAQARLEPPTAPTAGATVHDVKVRPHDEQTDGKFAPTPYAGKSSSAEPRHIRTTRERITDGSAPPAVAPLQPPPAKP